MHGAASAVRHPRKDGAASALKPGEAKALERALRMFTEKALFGSFIIGAAAAMHAVGKCSPACRSLQAGLGHLYKRGGMAGALPTLDSVRGR